MSLSLISTVKRDSHAPTARRAFLNILHRPQHLATFLFRLSSYSRNVRVVGKFLSWFFWRLNNMLSGCDIDPLCVIGPGLNLVHPQGIVVGRANIGNDVKIYQNSTIGQRKHGYQYTGYPTIGNNVTIYAGAVIAGEISIGEDAVIGANTFVNKDIPAGSTVIPAASVILPPKPVQG